MFKKILPCLSFIIIFLSAAPAFGFNDLFWQSVKGSGDLYAIVCGNNTFVAVGANGLVKTSGDGLIWTNGVSGTDRPLFGVAWDGSRFLAVGGNGVILASPDGMMWKDVPSGTRYSLRHIVGGQGRTIIVGEKGTVLFSADGTGWKAAESGTAAGLNSAAFNGKVFAAVGDDSTILTSSDGINWAPSKAVIQNNTRPLILEDVQWMSNKFLIVGYINKEPSYPVIIESADAVNWSVQVLEYIHKNNFKNIRLYTAAWDGTQPVAAGSHGSIVTLPDCRKCIQFQTLSEDDLKAAACDGRRIVAVGMNGIVFTALLNPDIRSVTPEVAREKMEKGALLIDVRTEKEYREKHIKGSVLLSTFDIRDKIQSLVPDRNREIIVYCATGVRSRWAAELLAKLGYTRVYDLGGINRWPYEVE